ncbi:hypothetical protein CLOP_g11337 [Closterium sp. NIES-67]|nr:hypothetical protein CLOP_g11337 [Closterium sp. NIES-67]
MAKGGRAGDGRLLSLPDELLQIILALANHPSDRCSVALSCSRLRRLSRSTPHTLLLEFYSPRHAANPRAWLKSFDDFSRVFTHVADLTVEITSGLGNQLMEGIAAGCPRLEKLRLMSPWVNFNVNGRAWRKLAKQCPHLTSLELDSRYARSPLFYAQQPPLPPVDVFPALRSLALLYLPSDYLALPRCSSLTSLTLWGPEPSTLSSLASSSPSPSSSSPSASLKSLTNHAAKLHRSLSPLALFPALSSLSFLSCTIDPYALHSLSHSLHTLTHLTVHSCPLVSSHSLAPLLQSNPALSSLSLRGTTYRLFSAQGFRSLLSASSSASQLHTLRLCGLPSFRPGVLAGCSGLRSLSVEGVIEAQDLVPHGVSLDSLVSMLVRVERRGGGGGGWGEAGGEGGGAERMEEEEEAVETEGRGNAGAPAAATVAAAGVPASPAATGAAAAAAAAEAGGGERGSVIRGRYVDIRIEAASAQADKIAAASDIIHLFDTADEATKAARSDALWAASAEGERAVARITASFGKIRSGISACRAFCLGTRESNAAIEREDVLMRAFAAAGQAPGFFMTELVSGQEGEDGGEGDEIRGMDGAVLGIQPEDGLAESLLGGVRSGAVGTREEALRVLHSLVARLGEHTAAMTVSLRCMRRLSTALRATLARPPVDGAAAEDGAAAGGATAGGAAAGGAAAGSDVTAAAAATDEERAAGRCMGGEERAPGGGGPGEATPGEATPGEAVPGEVTPGQGTPVKASPGNGRQPRGRRELAGKRTEGRQGRESPIPVEVFCPRLESLTLQVLYFSSTPLPKWLPPTLSSESPLMYLCSPPPPSTIRSSPSPRPSPSPSSSLSSSAPSPSIQPQSFESIARAAVFGSLKQLTLVCCLGLEEQQWLDMLRACAKLEELRVQNNDKFSDRVLAGSTLERLADFTVLACDKVTAAGIGGVLGSFPRLRHLKVEASKVQDRGRRELLRAGVVIRGIVVQ